MGLSEPLDAKEAYYRFKEYPHITHNIETDLTTRGIFPYVLGYVYLPPDQVEVFIVENHLNILERTYGKPTFVPFGDDDPVLRYYSRFMGLPWRYILQSDVSEQYGTSYRICWGVQGIRGVIRQYGECLADRLYDDYVCDTKFRWIPPTEEIKGER